MDLNIPLQANVRLAHSNKIGLLLLQLPTVCL